MDIDANLATYLGGREPTARYTSFDYCFNYFRSQQEMDRLPDSLSGPSLRLACLHLGFYLASWGMLRASTVLHRKSLKYYVPVVEALIRAPSEIWCIDADQYTDEAIGTILEVRGEIRAAFPEGASDILVTKIMLGVFGCVPAFDGQFMKGFGVKRFGPEELRRIGDFYADNVEVIEQHRVPTLDFDTGKATTDATRVPRLSTWFSLSRGAPAGSRNPPFASAS